MDKTQEYVVGQKQYERPKPSANYGSQQGMGIDLDDLNRELSKEIQRYIMTRILDRIIDKVQEVLYT